MTLNFLVIFFIMSFSLVKISAQGMYRTYSSYL